MMVAHSRPPNHTVTCLSAPPLNKRGRTQKLGKCSQTSYTVPWNNKPVAPHHHGLTSSKPATQKGGQNSQTETLEHPEQPSNTRLKTVSGPQEQTCLPRLKTGWLLAFSARHNKMAGTEKGEGDHTTEQPEARARGPPYDTKKIIN
ncbi:hypothetical protein E2C01_000848 [Portunus trituberculatus]|uniref:Uncharacterized protein n=1 Tax=Portunus trituberculatus TaxID=210409 RepID=A0A5B7CFQ4_PORTR|nr:hypothetical protein [Portunus trituberculatus]